MVMNCGWYKPLTSDILWLGRNAYIDEDLIHIAKEDRVEGIVNWLLLCHALCCALFFQEERDQLRGNA